jgi:hypothetical protein
MEDVNERRVRAGRNQSMFRFVNERIDEVVDDWGDDTDQYVCECLDTSCSEVLHGLSHDEYRQIRHDDTEFVVAPGHEQPEVEEVVDRHPRWLVVRKLGVAAKVAQDLAPGR